MTAVSLSQCDLWRLQESYYSSLGVQAWNERTPYYVTNSTVIAEAYADLLVAMLLDRPLENPDEPLTLLEVGTGTGRLAFYLARELERKLAYFPATRKVRFRLVLTDLAEANLEFWDQHERLQGDRFDFALFRAGEDPALKLRRSGETIERFTNPLVVIANYFFDSLAQDEFRVKDGVLEECLVELVRKTPNQEARDARDVEVVRSYQAIDPTTRYAERDLSELLQHYTRTVTKGSFTIPTASLAVLRGLRKLGRLVMLSSDRAFTSVEHMTHYPDHPFQLHEGAFSHLVNYPALTDTFKQAWLTTHRYLDSLQTVCALDLEEELPHLDYAFRERLDRVNLVNTANEMFALVRDRTDSWRTSLPAFVRLNLADPQALAACANKLAGVLPRLNYSEGSDLVELLETVWRNDYHFPGGPNLTFWLGHLSYGIGRFEPALDFFQRTIDRYGRDEVLLFLKGNCLDALGRREEACDCYQQALMIKPDFLEAQKALLEAPAPAP